MTVPPAERYFEDYHVGLADEFGEITVTAEEIVEFASRYRRCTSIRRAPRADRWAD
jgi:hypothetical protein